MIKARIRGGQGVSRRLREIQQRLTDQKRVYVGLPEGSPRTEDGQSLVEIGAIHEFGAKNIPERSFLRVPLNGAQDKFRAAFKEMMPKVARGELTMMQALEAIGDLGVGISKEAISAGIKPPNAKSTVKRKGSSTPLVDKGHLRQWIVWVIKNPGDV